MPFWVLHTNQHVAQSMCAAMYEDMEYQPDLHLPGSYRLGAAIDWLQDTFRDNKISHVVVNGDTAAALAGAVSALYSDISLTHIEAGLRSGDRYMLEERNRIMVDSVADLLVAYTAYEAEALRASKSVRGQVVVEGNTTADVLEDFASRLLPPKIIEGPYLFATMHRREFTECPTRMREVFSTFAWIAESVCPVILPMHLRTRDAMARHGIPLSILGQVSVLEPLPIFDSLSLQKHATAVLTDSGCIQEEAYMLGVPCVTIRDNTERHLTVQHGANSLTGFSSDDIVSAVRAALSVRSHAWPPIYGGPGAGQRIVDRILHQFG